MQNINNSLTAGSIGLGMIRFAIPIFLGNLFQQFYNLADTLIVGIFLGDNALAAVSSSGNLIFMFVGFFNGLAMGAGVLIARYFGAKDYDKVDKVIHTNIAFGMITGVVLTVAGVLLTPTILRWMGTPEDVFPNSVSYFLFYFCGAIFIVMYNIFVGIMHAMGDSKHPLYYLIISSFVNIVLDILFVGVFHWGVGFAALATTISQGISVVLCCRRMLKSDGPGKLQFSKIRIHRQSLLQILHYGIPSGVQNSVIALANVVVQSNINAFGSAAMAGCGAYAKLEGFAFLPVNCFVQALSTFVGQNIGANKLHRVKKGAIFGVLCSVFLAEVVGVCFYIFIPNFLKLFHVGAEALAFGVMHCRRICIFYALLAFSHCAAGILRGAGKPMIPMGTMLICWCVIRVSYITIAVRFIPKLETISVAYPFTWFCSGVVFTIYLLCGNWLRGVKENSVVHT